MNIIIFILFFVLIGTSLFSQDVSVNLSVKEKEYVIDSIFTENKFSKSVLFLNVEYVNNSCKPIYFHKKSSNLDGFPVFNTLFMTGLDKRSFEEKAKKYYDYSGGKYNVIIDNRCFMFSGWELFDDTISIKESHTYMINNDLNDIYMYFCSKKYLSQHKILYKRGYYIKSTDINNDSIIHKSEIKNQFVFLNPGESYVDTYNLIGFQMIGGNFTFKINDELLNYTCIGIEQDKKIFFPKNINGFELYEGRLVSNEVNLKLIGWKSIK